VLDLHSLLRLSLQKSVKSVFRVLGRRSSKAVNQSRSDLIFVAKEERKQDELELR